MGKNGKTDILTYGPEYDKKLLKRSLKIMEKREMVKAVNEGYASVLHNPIINIDNGQDNLQNVTLSLLEKIDKGTITADSFCMLSKGNMARYLVGGIKLQYLKIKQNNENMISFETISNDYGYAETSITPKTDLFGWIMEQKNSKGKNLFDKQEIELITGYYIEQKTFKELSKETGKTKRQLEYKVKYINQKIAKLPIKDVVGAWYMPCATKVINKVNPFVIELPKKSLLKKAVRKGDKKAMVEYRKQAQTNMAKNRAWPMCSLYPMCPVDCRAPDTYRPKKPINAPMWYIASERSQGMICDIPNRLTEKGLKEVTIPYIDNASCNFINYIDNLKRISAKKWMSPDPAVQAHGRRIDRYIEMFKVRYGI